MERLSAEQYRIEEYTESHFEGTITTSDAGETVLTTIPYDEGWQVYVDGEKVEITKAVNALVAFDIESAGTHTLELVYSPKIVNLGALISLGSVLIFAALILGEYFIKKRKCQKAESAAEVENESDGNVSAEVSPTDQDSIERN